MTEKKHDSKSTLVDLERHFYDIILSMFFIIFPPDVQDLTTPVDFERHFVFLHNTLV